MPSIHDDKEFPGAPSQRQSWEALLRAALSELEQQGVVYIWKVTNRLDQVTVLQLLNPECLLDMDACGAAALTPSLANCYEYWDDVGVHAIIPKSHVLVVTA